MDRVLSDKKAISIFILPAFLLFIVIVALPIAFSVYYSLLDWNGLGDKIYIGFQNYVDLFVNNPELFPQSIVNSLKFAFVSVFIQLPVSLMFALILARGIKGENLYRIIYFIPVVMSTIVIGQLWMKVYHPDYGLLNTLLQSIGLEELTRSWLADMDTVLGASFVPILWQYVGYHMLLMYASIKSVSTDIYEAAKIDGASEFQTAFKITIPLISPMLKVCALISVINSLKIFDLIYVLTNGGPAHASEVPSTLMVNAIVMRSKYGYGSAMAVFIIVECLVFALLIQKFFKTADVN